MNCRKSQVDLTSRFYLPRKYSLCFEGPVLNNWTPLFVLDFFFPNLFEEGGFDRVNRGAN